CARWAQSQSCRRERVSPGKRSRKGIGLRAFVPDLEKFSRAACRSPCAIEKGNKFGGKTAKARPRGRRNLLTASAEEVLSRGNDEADGKANTPAPRRPNLSPGNDLEPDEGSSSPCQEACATPLFALSVS